MFSFALSAVALMAQPLPPSPLDADRMQHERSVNNLSRAFRRIGTQELKAQHNRLAGQGTRAAELRIQKREAYKARRAWLQSPRAKASK